MTRRTFLAATAAATLAPAEDEAVIDLHQHTNYSGRSDEALLAHQRTMGITRTVLLPAGSRLGLDADCGGNETVVAMARRHPKEFAYFANELPDLPEARPVIEKHLKAGAIGIGEQKFPVECDSPHIDRLAELAREYGVPVLLHFEHGRYNKGFERFHRVLARHPRVNFIGHAQTWWANVHKGHDQSVLYPQHRVTAGGITDRLMADYPNMYGDLSARSGLNSMLRDEEHARAFLLRHQDRLIYGSDCNDKAGKGEGCIGSRGLEALRRLVTDRAALRKILAGNARRVMKV